MASGRENSLNEFPPCASNASMRASISGWSGTANGSRVVMTLLNALPGTSPPCQKLSVPDQNHATSSFDFFNIVEGRCPVPFTKQAVLGLSDNGRHNLAH